MKRIKVIIKRDKKTKFRTRKSHKEIAFKLKEIKYKLVMKEEIIKILEAENPGLLPDEAEIEANKILYRKDIYEEAKSNLQRNK